MTAKPQWRRRVTINWFSRIRRTDNIIIEEDAVEKEYASISGIVEVIEFDRDQKEINGVLLDAEGREFQFKVTPDGGLLRLIGVKEDLPLAWQACVTHLKEKYGRNEIQDLQIQLGRMMKAIYDSIEELSEEIEQLSEEIAQIEIPEIIPQVQALPVVEEKEIIIPQIVEEELDDEDEKEYEDQFQDFSDEDLASHALKVLSGEVSLDA